MFGLGGWRVGEVRGEVRGKVREEGRRGSAKCNAIELIRGDASLDGGPL